MNAKLLILSAVLVSPFVLAANAPLARLRFSVAEGTSLTKTFENKATLSLENQVIEGMSGSSAPEIEMSMVMNQHVVVTDEYVKMGDGVPTRLVRTYDDLGGDVTANQKMELMGQRNEREQNMRSKSALTGRKVLFAWDSEKNAFTKSFQPEDDEPALLAGLQEDMDLRALLPRGEVAPGDTWDVDLKDFHSVMMPGGNVSLVPETTDAESMKMGGGGQSLSQLIGPELTGSVRATLASVKEIEGVPCARIDLEVQLHSQVDMTESARKAVEEGEAPDGIEIAKIDVEFALDGKGELVWDLSAGHFRTFELSGRTSIKTSVHTKVEVNGKVRDIKQTSELAGTSGFSAKTK